MVKTAFVVFVSDGVGYAHIEGIFDDLALAKSQLLTCIENTNKVIEATSKTTVLNQPFIESELSEYDVEANVVALYTNGGFNVCIMQKPLNQLNGGVLDWYKCYEE